MQKPTLPKGTRDFLPHVMLRRKYILSVIEGIFRTYGFLPIETPAMENLSTLTGKYGDEGDKLLFKVLNSGDFLKDIPANDLEDLSTSSLLKHISDKGLRYDLTVPLARFVVQNRNELQMPFRRYQIQPVWRADKPQKGRYREFWQCDADIIGSDSLVNECDLLKIYQEVFQSLDLGVTIFINNRKILEGFAETINASGYFKSITIIIDKLDKIGIDGVSKELAQLGLNEDQIHRMNGFLKTFDLNDENLHSLEHLLQKSEIGLKGIAELKELVNLTNLVQLEAKVIFNGGLARGLDYYTGCIFEVVSNETQMGSISGGGRYDNLTGVFGMDGLSGVGISFGIDRIYDIMDTLNRFPELEESGTKVLCCHFDKNGQHEGMRSAVELRKHGIATEVFPDNKKFQKQIEYANKRGIPYLLVWGESELQNERPTLKNMKNGEQIAMKLGEIINQIQ